ncbi:hypothetical protein SteCoe_24160 [Stentor coeruleus]|uniref:Uncharacterized protein n=1 Tax=Stentor coeruleus TaxID=5963 RepID=A0A1R2BI43_9CILI|nr:hypothetical protein SteCoe_24160 [Stentor coeruleus]
MDNLIFLFENENIPLKESMQTALGYWQINSDHIKSIYKSLLLVHVSKIEELEERLLWQELISKLDGFNSQDLTLHSFGPLEKSSSFKNSSENNEKTYEIPIRKDKFDKKMNYQILEKKAKALKNTIKIGLRLKIVDCFWVWRKTIRNLDRMSKEYYFKKLKNKVVICWKSCGCYFRIQNAMYKKAYMHYKKRTKIFIMMKWAEYIRDRYREKIEYYVSGGDNSRAKKFTYEKVAYKEYRKPLTGNKKEAHKSEFLYKTTENKQKPFSKIIKNKLNLNKTTFYNTAKRTEMLKNLKKHKKSYNCPTKKYMFLSWKNLTKYKILGKTTYGIIWKNLTSWGFRIIRTWVIKGNTNKNQRGKHSIANLTNYELSMKIGFLEKKLGNLHYQMLNEQINKKYLISEKQEILKYYA